MTRRCSILLSPSLYRICDYHYLCFHVGGYGCPRYYILYDNRWCDTGSYMYPGYFPPRLLVKFITFIRNLVCGVDDFVCCSSTKLIHFNTISTGRVFGEARIRGLFITPITSAIRN